MSYKKFEKNDIFFNTIKTKPYFKFKVYGGKTYLENNNLNYVYYANLNTVPVLEAGCSNPNSFDFSCEDNSYNIATI